MSLKEQVCVPEIWLTTTPMSTMKTMRIGGGVQVQEYDPEGVEDISRGLSEAKPPEQKNREKFHRP